MTDKDRDFWAFRPPQPVAVPPVRDAHARPQSDRRLRPAEAGSEGADALAGGRPRDAAAPRVLRSDRLAARAGRGRRPSSRTTSPDAYEKLIDRLLASPRYGERWGRHWLDLAGYADSEGKREQDLPRPHAWRYRDYVIRALQRRQAVRPLSARAARRRRTGRLRAARRRSRRRSTTTSSRPASCAWPPTRPGRTSPASSPTASR